MDAWVRDNPEANQSALDIEDLGRLGRGSGPCPYYAARALADSADLVFLPYNYLARAPLSTDVLPTLTLKDTALHAHSHPFSGRGQPPGLPALQIPGSRSCLLADLVTSTPAQTAAWT